MNRRGLMATVLGGALLGVALYACDVVDAPPNPDEPVPVFETTTTTAVPTTTLTAACEREPINDPPDLQGDSVSQSIALAQMIVGCVDTVVLAPTGSLMDGVDVALDRDGVLLAWEPARERELVETIEALDARQIVVTSQAIAPAIDLPVEIVSSGPSRPSPGSTVWLIEETTTDPSLLAYVGGLAGASVIVGTDVDDLTEAHLQLLAASEEFVWLPEPTPTERWQLSSRVEGIVTVNGTSDLLAGTRFIAFYGNPTTGALGVLGEQGPAATLDRMAPLVAEYAADGALAVPTFEIIVTVADAVAGDDGDYSAEMGPEVLRPWIDTATEAGAYVVLDLQPGRTDFLTQAKRYEEFLRLPNVGLALDPEWRLGPDERHLRQIGSVTAEEVNAVSEWLATEVVREHLLPQKLFVVHQFRLDMIEGREQIELRPELATVIQMDGQGPLDTKYETYAVLTSPADAERFGWGWKNFYDEDSPMANAGQVLGLEPVPVFVSFQ